MSNESNVIRLYGEGGKGGGGSPPVNDPVTLVAKQAMYILMAVSEGEITSIEDIYLDDTSISNFTASFAFTRGETSQALIPYFNATSIAEGFSNPITKYELGGGLSEGVVKSILGSFEYVDITIQLNNLFYLTSTGDNLATSVSFAIYTSPSSITAEYTLVASPTISGKAIQPYPFNVRVYRPTQVVPAEWQIKILRLSAEADQYYNSASQLSLLTYASVDVVSTYPGTALIGIRLEDASQTGGNLPQISIRGHGCKLMLPDSSYYQASTGLYRNSDDTAWVSPTDITRATWNGNFHTVASLPTYQYSNNLSWAIYNIISDWLFFTVDNIRYPRGLETPKDYLAKYSFEEFARYCDELIEFEDPNTNIVTSERRYTLNRQFFERKDAKYARDEMLSLGNADLLETGGFVSIIWDRPFTELEVANSPLFTNQNVSEGKFEYASSDIVENYTQINVTIQEIDNRNRTRTLTVMASELEDYLEVAHGYFTDKYGYQSSDFLVLGTSSVAAGIRKGRSLLWDALMVDLEGDGIIQFKCLIEGALLHKGSLIRVADNAVFDTVVTGRIVSFAYATGVLSITLDRAITCSGVTYVLVYKDDGTVVELALNETSGIYTEVTVTIATISLMAQSIFVQKTNRVTPYKVTNVTYDEELFTIEAIKYDERKYGFVDAKVILPTPSTFSEVPHGKTEAVYNLKLQDFPNQDDISRKHFTLSWQHNTLSDRIYRYQIEWNVSTGQSGVATSYQKEFDFVQIVSTYGATYSFTVTALSSLDYPSNPTTITFEELRWDDGTSWSTTDPNNNYVL